MSWEIGISTGVVYQKPIEEILPAIAANGFHAIEVATARTHVDPKDSARVQTLQDQVRKLGLKVRSLHAPFGQGIDITDADPGLRRLSLRHLREAADLLRSLGGALYVIHPGGEDHNWIWEKDGRLRRSVEGLTEVWGMCRERGLTLVVETPLPHLLGGSMEDFSWILARIPEEGTGVCVDTSHTSLGGKLFEAIDRFSDRLVHLQASDNHGKHDDHLPPGEGIIQWPAVIQALERARYRGMFLLEVNGRQSPAESVERVAASVERWFPGWKAREQERRREETRGAPAAAAEHRRDR
jgi:sugar phosphate isomerase/epimerase